MIPSLVLFIAIICAIVVVVFFRVDRLGKAWPSYLHYPAVLIIILGVWLSCNSSEVITSAWQMKQWPVAKATVIESTVAGTRAFHPEITYRYSIDGRNFESKTDMHIAGFGGKRSRHDTAEKIIADFPAGTSIMVHYNPLNPQESYLRSGPFWSDYMQLSLGFMLTVIGFLVFFSLQVGKFIRT